MSALYPGLSILGDLVWVKQNEEEGRNYSGSNYKQYFSYVFSYVIITLKKGMETGLCLHGLSNYYFHVVIQLLLPCGKTILNFFLLWFGSYQTGRP